MWQIPLVLRTMEQKDLYPTLDMIVDSMVNADDTKASRKDQIRNHLLEDYNYILNHNINYLQNDNNDEVLEQTKFYVVENNEEIIACVGLQKMTYVGTEEVVDRVRYELRHLFISPKYQGEGIGKKLVKQIIQDAQELNLDILYLQSANETSTGFYEHIGFNVVKKPWFDGECPVMKYALNNTNDQLE